jgi:hypothetical protein
MAGSRLPVLVVDLISQTDIYILTQHKSDGQQRKDSIRFGVYITLGTACFAMYSLRPLILATSVTSEMRCRSVFRRGHYSAYGQVCEPHLLPTYLFVYPILHPHFIKNVSI